MQAHLIRAGGELLVYDPTLVEPPDPDWFEPERLAAQGRILGQSSGRRAAYFVSLPPHTLVLRHYWRGGMMARLSADRYLWLGEQRTRVLREWQLLQTLHERGLPVPRPAAARLRREGLSYSADLLTLRIPDTDSLAARVGASALSAPLWEAVGRCLRRFHDAGAYHADLNAHNILLDRQDRVFVIDWDRGRLIKPARRWQQANLARLFRSLEKLHRLRAAFHYDQQCRERLLAGYEGR
jgi:3-deoxy-D-manno-octulosonic acid kinase